MSNLNQECVLGVTPRRMQQVSVPPLIEHRVLRSSPR